MSVHVQVPSPLRSLTAGEDVLDIEANDVSALLEELESRHPGFRERVLDAKGELRKLIRVYVNDQDIRMLDDKRTVLKEGDVVVFLPAIAGGAS